MSCGSLLVMSELNKLGISGLNSILCISQLVVIHKWFHVVCQQWVLLSSFAALHLLDVIHVGPAHDDGATKQEDEPSFTQIVRTIWLVPVWELTYVLVCKLSLISGLRITW